MKPSTSSERGHSGSGCGHEAITADQNVRIIGGQMASLLLTAFPVPGIAARRTRDADAAITTELAGSGVIHQRLLDRGYTASSGNSYTRPVPDLAVAGGPVPELTVDLLIPSRRHAAMQRCICMNWLGAAGACPTSMCRQPGSQRLSPP